MDVGIYGENSLKANTLWPLPEQPRIEVGTLWSGECFPNIFWVQSALSARWINTSNTLNAFLQDNGTYQQENAKCPSAVSENA
ncbi:hypothetical protein TNCV_1331761 [Trichonephila clavipes]|nr:hypothetical protein TNCV_1331761 [Trichonephila clavipes]